MTAPYDDGVLYILMRKDMNSLNHAGKMVAQGAHAANHAGDCMALAKFGTENRTAWMKWEKSTEQGFGTTIVLGGMFESPLTLGHLQHAVLGAVRLGYAGAVITDPTYPLQDGAVVHAFPCETCAWVFGSKTGLEMFLKYYRLHGQDSLPS